MSYRWPAQDVNLRHFSPVEFDLPHFMDGLFLIDLDDLRSLCGFGVRITDDARSRVDMARLYGPKTAKWPDSAHLYKPEQPERSEYLVRCVDLKPAAAITFEEREDKELTLVYRATQFYHEGRWPCLGLEIATAHLHFDDYNWSHRTARRPTIFPGVSR